MADKYNWELAVFDELSPNQTWTKESIIAEDDPTAILKVLGQQYGYEGTNEYDMIDAHLTTTERFEINGILFRDITCRGSRGHLFLIRAVATAEA